MKFLLIILKNLRRNRMRSILTGLAVFFLVLIFSMIVSVVLFLDNQVATRARDVKMVITERYRLPSRFDTSYMKHITIPGYEVNTRLSDVPGFDKDKHTYWHFVGFTLDLNDPPKDKNLFFFVIATVPEKIPYMIDGLEGDVDTKLAALMKNPPVSRKPNIGMLMGPERLKALGKKVGDVFPARSISHRDGSERKPIEMEFEIVGELPAESRWTTGAFIDYEYLDRVLKEKKSELEGKINLGWLQVEDNTSAGQVSGVLDKDIPDLKCETSAAGVGRFLEPFQDLLRGIKFILCPVILIVMVVIVANSISITVRERTAEMAVLKVLGFSKARIFALVLGEGVLVGTLAGAMAGFGTYYLVNRVGGGIPIPIVFFPKFFISPHALWWGPVLGAATAFLGGVLPARSGCAVKVSEVFSKVT